MAFTVDDALTVLRNEADQLEVDEALAAVGHVWIAAARTALLNAVIEIELARLEAGLAPDASV